MPGRLVGEKKRKEVENEKTTRRWTTPLRRPGLLLSPSDGTPPADGSVTAATPTVADDPTSNGVKCALETISETDGRRVAVTIYSKIKLSSIMILLYYSNIIQYNELHILYTSMTKYTGMLAKLFCA